MIAERLDMVKMRKTLRQAKNVVFLGFGFIPKNVRLLDVHTAPRREQVHNMDATAFGERTPRRTSFEVQIKTAISRSGTFYPGGPEDSCLQLLRDYSHDLST